jgi:hypothetical protein
MLNQIAIVRLMIYAFGCTVFHLDMKSMDSFKNAWIAKRADASRHDLFAIRA